jgi:hypothetical protein
LIYIDSSVALAQLLIEDRRPPDAIWQEPLVSSEPLQYEVWNRIHARGLGRSHASEVEALLARVNLAEMTHRVLLRALQPFPTPVRTLDELHLATVEFLRAQGERLRLASYDTRLLTAAGALGIESAQL